MRCGFLTCLREAENDVISDIEDRIPKEKHFFFTIYKQLNDIQKGIDQPIYLWFIQDISFPKTP
jgi:hypothetical protein